jgi:chromosome segregation protein
MGNVNTGAAEEFRRLTERFDFLAGQRADLEQACGALRETIAEIDRSTRAVFMSTFEAVGVEFQKLFVRLFEGGQTRLDLTKPDDLLETGIEIIVQPPGKRLQSLSLLSGGERALTAVALLFSFLAVRPSPFVLLDEVDAPLDGPNVDRFVGLVRDFSKDTQFVIITHNPTTMAGAPRWYGVTMQEPGVSRVIAYRPVQPERPATSDAPP